MDEPIFVVVCHGHMQVLCNSYIASEKDISSLKPRGL